MQIDTAKNSQQVDAEFIDPFLLGVKQVFNDMVGLDPVAQPLFSYAEANPMGDVASVMPLQCSALTGQLCISFKWPALLNVAEQLLGESLEDMDTMVLDVAGEITNIVTGVAKALLVEKGYDFALARPTTVVADNFSDLSLIGSPRIVVPFEIPSGKIFVDLGIVPV